MNPNRRAPYSEMSQAPVACWDVERPVAHQLSSFIVSRSAHASDIEPEWLVSPRSILPRRGKVS